VSRYAYFKKLTYFSTECIYSPDGECDQARTGLSLSTSTAYRGHARVFLKDLEAIRPSAIIDIIHSGETFQLDEDVKSGMKALRESLESGSTLEAHTFCQKTASVAGTSARTIYAQVFSPTTR
jgi:cytoplasmic tRNA 2-thiolation protein 1